MKISEEIDMKGRLFMKKIDRQGNITEEKAADNSIVLTGRDLVARQFINETIAPVSHIAIGTGQTDINPGAYVALENELFRKAINNIVPNEHLTTTEAGKKKVLIAADLDFTEGNGALTEAGLFNADTGGVMYNRVVFPPINKTEDFKLSLIWEIIF